MATPRTHVPELIKRTLIEQAGRKCANPGCSITLLELHHIKEWHIYQTHDAEHMIALCATCHDGVDRGVLQISDETLYRWKGIDRSDSTRTGHIFVEPGRAPKLLLGSIPVQGESGVIVFDMSEGQRLSFAVRDGEIMLLNLKISDLDGNLLLDVVDGYVRQREASIELRTRPGAIEVPAGLNSPLIPNWIRERLLRGDEDYENLPLPLLSIEVTDRGVVRVQGFWMDTDKAIVITPERLSFISLGRQDPLALAAVGDEALLIWNGPIGASLFSWAS